MEIVHVDHPRKNLEVLGIKIFSDFESWSFLNRRSKFVSHKIHDQTKQRMTSQTPTRKSSTRSKSIQQQTTRPKDRYAHERVSWVSLDRSLLTASQFDSTESSKKQCRERFHTTIRFQFIYKLFLTSNALKNHTMMTTTGFDYRNSMICHGMIPRV